MMMIIFRFLVLYLSFAAAAAAASKYSQTTTSSSTPPRSSLQHVVQQQRQGKEYTTGGADSGGGGNGKNLPDIANPDCSAFATANYLTRNDIPLPCREQDDYNGAENDSPQFAPPQNGGGHGSGSSSTGGDGSTSDSTQSPQEEDTSELEGNRVRVTLFVGIRPFIPNIEPIVTAVVTKWLNSTIQNMNFFLNDPFVTRQRRQQQEQQRNLRQPRRRIQLDELLGIEGGSGSSGGGGDNTTTQQQPTTHASIFTLIHFDTESDLVVKTNRRWYWKHTVAYDCLYREDRSPVLDFTLLQYVTENVTRALDEDEDDTDNEETTSTTPGSLSLGSNNNNTNNTNHGLIMTLRQRTGDEGVTITIKPEELPQTGPDSTEPIGTLEPDGGSSGSKESRPPGINSVPPRGGGGDGTSSDQSVNDGGGGGDHHHGVTYPTPLNSQEWDWRRYLGLSLFLGTIVGTFVLSQIHAQHQRRLIKSQVWGNLASEEGVNELLKTGWKVQGTSNNKKVLEIYDKSKWGYRENDSMLIGGFEQREAVVGAEITLTHAPSETNTQANISITQEESHHTPPSPLPPPPPPPYTVATTPTGSVTTPPVQQQHHQYGSPPRTPPHGGGGGARRGPSTTTTTKNNNGSPPLSRSRF